jgi:nicotinamidase-related amidase
MKRTKNALLIIDPQVDFCDPKGKLYVNGAEKDMERVAKFILQNKEKIDYIAITLDSHRPIDISHPAFWQDCDGNHPGPFTIITP